jgi:hypothetical protein
VGLAGGGRAVCHDLRAGCAALTSVDGEPPNWSYVGFANTPDRAAGPQARPQRSRSTARVVHRLSLRASRRRLTIRLHLVEKGIVRVVLRPSRGGPVVARATRRLARGRHTLRVPLSSRVRPGAYRVVVALDGRPVKQRSVRVRR